MEYLIFSYFDKNCLNKTLTLKEKEFDLRNSISKIIDLISTKLSKEELEKKNINELITLIKEEMEKYFWEEDKKNKIKNYENLKFNTTLLKELFRKLLTIIKMSDLNKE